jgi:hypothetical protein
MPYAVTTFKHLALHDTVWIYISLPSTDRITAVGIRQGHMNNYFLASLPCHK